MRRRFIVAALAGWLVPLAAAGQDEVATLEPTLVDRASVSSSTAIARLLDALDLISIDPGSVERIDVYDITRNGFGDGDVAHIHPTEEVRILTHVGADLRAEMEGWAATAQREQHFSPLVEPDSLEALGAPLPAIIAGTLRAVERSYGRGLPFGLLLTSDGEERAVFEIWGYEPDSLRYRRPEQVEGRARYDLVDIVRRQTEVIADDVAFDLLYIHASSTDTLYLPDPLPVSDEAEGLVREIGGGDGR